MNKANLNQRVADNKPSWLFTLVGTVVGVICMGVILLTWALVIV